MKTVGRETLKGREAGEETNEKQRDAGEGERKEAVE